MLRDSSVFHGEIPTVEMEDAENAPSFPSSGIPFPHADMDASRPPLHTIQMQSPNPKRLSDSVASKRKLERTPSKRQSLGCDGYPPFRTPEKAVAAVPRNRFGWAAGAKGEPVRYVGVDGGDELGHQFPSQQIPTPGRGLGICLGTTTPHSYRCAGKASSVQSESSSTQSTPTKSVSRPAYSGTARPPLSAGQRALNSFSASKGACVPPPIALNVVEVPHFELREDPSFWMDNNVQVVIRIRPLNSIEKNLQGYNRCLKQESAQSLVWIGQPEARFTFDHVACESVTQEMLFRVAGLPMVENCLSGYNSCVFAYGQTGSGKTYTMLGEVDDLEIMPSSDRGMTPRIFEFLFARIRAEEESRRDENLKYNCKCSFLEIYNEQISDLLDPSSTNLLLREDIQKGIYVENLSEFEVESVHDIIRLLMQGASNRKVAATNMNRESSRSHCVFTCVIESRWQNDATSNLRFAKLNLVDLAGSERQKASGAHGDRLKEAANINKSLSTLGHVIMILADIANGKQRHVPYRDSKLTFLLQESLGGNSKMMIIANVSPSMCCANESFSTLKFAQRARLVQNNAVVNEDSSGDVAALKHEIRLLKEELLFLKHHNVSRSLSYQSATTDDSGGPASSAMEEDVSDMAQEKSNDGIEVYSRQVMSLQETLSGALRREMIADAAIVQHEAEIAQLKHLICQREEDTQRFKMVLKFREEKIQRMESLLGGVLSAETYALKENNALCEEMQLLRTRVERNPEVTRFALENIRLRDQLKRFQDFYQEGEREILLNEVADMRNQLAQVLDGKLEQDPHLKLQTGLQQTTDEVVENLRNTQSLQLELEETCHELEKCRTDLARSIEHNAKLTREINDFRAELENIKLANCVHHDFPGTQDDAEMCLDSPRKETGFQPVEESTTCNSAYHAEEILSLQLELDILKEILKEVRSSHCETEQKFICSNHELNLKHESLMTSRQHEDLNNELEQAKSVIEALEYQNILTINDVEKLKEVNDHNIELLKQQDREMALLRKRLHCDLDEKQTLLSVQEEVLENSLMYSDNKDSPLKVEGKEILLPVEEELLRNSLKFSDNKDSPLQVKLKRMQASLEKALVLNTRYQSAQVSHVSLEHEMVRKQVEAETAEVIVCLQEELTTLQKPVEDSNRGESMAKESLVTLQIELGELKDQLILVKQDNEMLCFQVENNKRDQLVTQQRISALQKETEDLKHILIMQTQDKEMLHELVEDKETDLSALKESWERLAYEIEETLASGSKAIEEASDQASSITLSIYHSQIGEQLRSVMRSLNEKDDLIGQLQTCLEDAQVVRNDLERKLMSLRGATMAITEAQQQESRDKEEEILLLKSQILEKDSTIIAAEDRIRKAEICAAVAFTTLSRFSQENTYRLDEFELLKTQNSESEKSLSENDAFVTENEKNIVLSRFSNDFREKLDKFKNGIDTLNSCISSNGESTMSQEEMCIPSEICAEFESSNTMDRIRPQPIDISGLQNDQKKQCLDGQVITLDNDPKHCTYAYEREATFILLRKELEAAMDSLEEVRSQMVKIIHEKDELKISEVKNRENIEQLKLEVLQLNAQVMVKEQKYVCQLNEVENKLQAVERDSVVFRDYYERTKEVLKLEMSNTKSMAAQKAAEVSYLLVKVEEAQGAIEDADLTISALVEAKASAELEIMRLKKTEASLSNDMSCLISQVNDLQSCLDAKEIECACTEQKHNNALKAARSSVLELEDSFSLLQESFSRNLEIINSSFKAVKSDFICNVYSLRSCLEDIYSAIIGKDCAVSVLHLCHLGILLERVMGLNVENGFLSCGLCESNSMLSVMRENNARAERELETCSLLKGKLLLDINDSFRRIIKNENETAEFGARLHSFERKIAHLHLLEESMLSRANSMGSELGILMRDFDENNRNAAEAESIQVELLRENEGLRKELQEKSKLLDRVNQVHEILRESFCEEFNLLVGNPYSRKILDDLRVSSCTVSRTETEPYRKFIEHKKESFLQRNAAEDFTLLALRVDLDQRAEEIIETGLNLAESKRQAVFLGAVAEKFIEEVVLSKVFDEFRDSEINSLVMENEQLKTDLIHMRKEYLRISEDSENVNTQYQEENAKLLDNIISLETCINGLKMDVEVANEELKNTQVSFNAVSADLNAKSLATKLHIQRINTLELGHQCLKSELEEVRWEMNGLIRDVYDSLNNCFESVRSLENIGEHFGLASDQCLHLVDSLCQDLEDEKEAVSTFIFKLNILDDSVNKLLSENSSLQITLMQKDVRLKDLSFDLSLQEKQEELDKMAVAFESLHAQLYSKSCKLQDAFTDRNILEARLQERNKKIESLEMEIVEKNSSLNLVYVENNDAKEQMERFMMINTSLEEGLEEKTKVVYRLEDNIRAIGNLLSQRDQALEDLQHEMTELVKERYSQDSELLLLREKLEMAQALAEENEAVAVESRQIAEERMVYAQEKEEEVRLLERSIEELEFTVNALEGKVENVKGEAERQRLQREELEMGMGLVKCQMMSVASSSAQKYQISELSRQLNEKSSEFLQLEKNIQFAQKEAAERDAEITQLKAHINELSVHAEAQAREYKQKFKELELMAQEVKTDQTQPSIASLAPTTKSEKGAVSVAKPKGSGSPFKCIGLGLTQQMNSEKDEELTAAKKRIEELEALTATKQKEVFMLNTRLAATESMTHDVIRDLLGVKLNVANCATILDYIDVQNAEEPAELNGQNPGKKDREICQLKKQLSDVAEEQQSLQDEINNRQAEVTAARIAMEKLRQREQLLATENEVIKADSTKYKNLAMELELEIEKLSKQQDLRHRIHHHAKIKQENAALMIQNDELHAKLQQSEADLSRVEEELSRHKASAGRNPYNDLKKLQATGFSYHQECGSVSLASAEGALNRRIRDLQVELEDRRTECRMYRERFRLAELDRGSSSDMSSR